MAATSKPGDNTLQKHLDSVVKRRDVLSKLPNLPDYGDFLTNRENFIGELLDRLDKTNSLEEYYSTLQAAERVLGNRLQEVYQRKESIAFFQQHLVQSKALPCPDAELNYFMKIVFDKLLEIFADRLADEQHQSKPKRFSTRLLNVYLHEMVMLELQAGSASKKLMLEYLDQWANNKWPAAMQASDIVPTSWPSCVAKMKQVMEFEWKPAPMITVVDEQGTSHSMKDHTKTLENYVAHRAFLLALYLYCTIHPQFFESNMTNFTAKIKESVIGDLLQEWVGLRSDEMKKQDAILDSVGK